MLEISRILISCELLKRSTNDKKRKAKRNKNFNILNWKVFTFWILEISRYEASQDIKFKSL